jgi:hypothetical protein
MFICAVVILLCGCTHTTEAQAPDYSRTPVLFVHGHGLSSGIWNDMIAYLVNDGYPREYLHAVDIVPNTMANVQAATRVLAPAVESLLANAEAAARDAGYQGQVAQRVDIVSHSMGAVSSRWYAAKLRPDRVRVWISLAGANHGTDALCPFSDEAAREMCPAFATSIAQNAVQVNLNGTPSAPVDESPYGISVDRAGITRIPPDSGREILYISIRIEPDVWIKPESSAFLDGAGDVSITVPQDVPVVETSSGNYLFTGGAGHDDLPQHSDLIRFVAILLSSEIRVGVREGKNGKSLPSAFALNPNFPNPFHDGTNIRYQLAYPSQVIIKIYSIWGEEIRTLVSDYKDGGFHVIHWNGKDNGKRPVPSGIYFCKIETDNLIDIQPMILLR